MSGTETKRLAAVLRRHAPDEPEERIERHAAGIQRVYAVARTGDAPRTRVAGSRKATSDLEALRDNLLAATLSYLRMPSEAHTALRSACAIIDRRRLDNERRVLSSLDDRLPDLNIIDDLLLNLANAVDSACDLLEPSSAHRPENLSAIMLARKSADTYEALTGRKASGGKRSPPIGFRRFLTDIFDAVGEEGDLQYHAIRENERRRSGSSRQKGPVIDPP